MNLVYLQACVVELKPLRYTPAGIPVQELTLEYCSEVLEAGHTRKVEFVLSACAIGQLAMPISQLSLGVMIRVEGFLAPARKSSNKLVLHIQSVQGIQ